MTAFRQEIRFAAAAGGARIAYAISGEGPVLLRAAHWMSHLEWDWRSGMWGPWYERLARRHRFVRYDHRGCGLSDREVGAPSLDDLVADVEAVVDAAGLDRFALVGTSQGGAVAIRYAVRHPERVERLVLLAGFARGALKRGALSESPEVIDGYVKLIEAGWGRDTAAFHQLFTTQFWPRATPEQARSINEMQRYACTPQHAARLLRMFVEIDVADELAAVQCPTLVMHSRGDCRIPFEEARFIAARIPNARLVSLDTDQHVPLVGEPAFEVAMAEIDAFLPHGAPALDGFTARDRDIVDAIARGLDNAQIAARLGLAEKTVRNRVSAVFDRLGVENRPQAIVRARELGFGR
jgi:pimeloyl-ACP methyl ester carboxylesterase/DNA-binding CsgD family transcriptional regulator